MRSDNIDNGGVLIDDSVAGYCIPIPITSVSEDHGGDGANDCADGHAAQNLACRHKDCRVVQIEKDHDLQERRRLEGETTRIPVAFNHLTGHFTEALVSTASRAAPTRLRPGEARLIIRPAVLNNNNAMMGCCRITRL